MQKKLSIAIAVLLSGCSVKKEMSERNIVAEDSISKVATDSIPAAKASIQINFPLDSLLSFDSELELKKAFGEDVKRSVGYYPEGMGEYANTLLFPDTKNQVEFVWSDDSLNFSGLNYISIEGDKTDWRTSEGITLGTRLKELEKHNQKPFSFYGFGWDYSGTVVWEGGHLEERKISINLEMPDDAAAEDNQLLGDQEFKSDLELAQKVNPVVRTISMRK